MKIEFVHIFHPHLSSLHCTGNKSVWEVKGLHKFQEVKSMKAMQDYSERNIMCNAFQRNTSLLHLQFQGFTNGKDEVNTFEQIRFSNLWFHFCGHS